MQEAVMSMVTPNSGVPQNWQESWRPSKRQIIGAVIGVLALVFVVQNSRRGSIHFLFFEFTAPVWIAFLVILCAGAIVGYVLRGVRDGRKAEKKAASAD
jgi:uncharacterized integral membrane protein